MEDELAPNLEQAAQNRAAIAEIKQKYNSGAIDRDEAKRLAQPILERINAAIIIKTKELNKKYKVNRKPPLLDFINAMRNSY